MICSKIKVEKKREKIFTGESKLVSTFSPKPWEYVDVSYRLRILEFFVKL